ncbi:MAG: hypothetical protein FD145_1202, partial [Candidatus Saganbacteria bacterium]
MKKYLTILVCFFAALIVLFISTSEAATLSNIRYASYPQKVRLVFDFDGQAYYGLITSEGTLTLAFMSCEVSSYLKKDFEINDWVIKNVLVNKHGENVIVSMPILYPVNFTLTPLGSPSRLVVDFGRVFTKSESGGNITQSIKYKRIVKGTKSGYISAGLLEVDPKKTDIMPVMAKADEPFFKSVVEFFAPWSKGQKKHYYRERTSSIAKRIGAAGAVNGTYFSYTGRPLGVLMINGEAVSYPISDRTAFIIGADGQCYIDNIIMDSYFEHKGSKYEIIGINKPRESAKEIVLYNKYYGELTETSRLGFEITVENGKVTGTRIGNSRIPENGYVLSAGPLYAEHLSSVVKIGDDVGSFLNLIPYSANINGKVMHLVGGGPRLLKGGRVYISKYEEKFRPDIAKGRAARTAVGITKNGKILFVTVDGRPRKKIKKKEGFSIGMTLTELAYFMLSQGAVDALNLDGGSSS